MMFNMFSYIQVDGCNCFIIYHLSKLIFHRLMLIYIKLIDIGSSHNELSRSICLWFFAAITESIQPYCFGLAACRIFCWRGWPFCPNDTKMVSLCGQQKL
jgi:hypothetical protein